jgi:SAM-dependent methyltransferase
MTTENRITGNFQGENNRSYAGSEELWANEKYLIKYSHDVVSMLIKSAGNAKSVLEFGAGIGTLAQIWNSLVGVRPECLEIDPLLRQTLLQRGFVCYESVEFIDRKYDAIYSSNVLEHIEDDVAALKKMNTLLCNGSRMVIYVPAFMCIYSELDAYVGHYRRYSKKELYEKLERSGFDVITCEYVDSLGFFAWLTTRFRGYNSQKKLGSSKELKTYDTYIYPLSRFLDRVGFKYFFGKNILIVAEPKN